VVVVLAVEVMGTQLSPGLHAARLAPASVAIAALWVIGLVLLNRAGRGLPWREGGDAPDNQPEPRGHSRGKKEKAATDRGVGTGRAALVFAAAALATLVAGVVIERSGEEFFARQGLSGVLFGATVLAAATSLPEVSTGLTSTRLGDYQLAVSDIFGGNAFLPVLFLLATVISGKPVLPAAHDTDIYLTGLGIVLTVIYMTGLVFRPRRQYARMGIDSITAVVVYLVGIAGLATIAT
jgi:cation:H+ antiporter